MIDWFFNYFNQLCVGILLLAFTAFWVRGQFFSEYELDLEQIIANSLASVTLPTGVALVLCAFDSSLVVKLKDLHIYLAIAGAVLLFISARAVIRGFKEDEDTSDEQ